VQLYEVPSNKTGVVYEFSPSDLGFGARAISATGRLVGTAVDIRPGNVHALWIVTAGGTGVGRSELEFTGLAPDGTIIVPRTVVLGGAADIAHAVASPTYLTWAGGLTGATVGSGGATFVAATLDLFRAVPLLLIELNVTTLDAAAAVSMFMQSRV